MLLKTGSVINNELYVRGYFSYGAIEILNNAYDHCIGMAIAFSELPWSVISPYEGLSHAREVFAKRDIASQSECAKFYMDYGCLMDDNPQKGNGVAGEWYKKQQSIDKNSFWLMFGLNYSSFSEPKVVSLYAAYLKGMCELFDPSVQFNNDAIDKLKQREKTDGKKEFDFDLEAIFCALKKESSFYQKVEKSISMGKSRNDFRKSNIYFTQCLFGNTKNMTVKEIAYKNLCSALETAKLQGNTYWIQSGFEVFKIDSFEVCEEGIDVSFSDGMYSQGSFCTIPEHCLNALKYSPEFQGYCTEEDLLLILAPTRPEPYGGKRNYGF